MKFVRFFWIIILSLLIGMGCGEGERITAFKDVTLVPMTAEKIIEHQTVLVKGDRIFKIGPADKIDIPQNASVIDGAGAYLMPGLADMHVHLREDWPLHPLDLYLANGVTTVRDLDGREFMLQWRDEINAGKRGGPRIYVAAQTIRGYEKDAPQLVSERISGYDCIKLYSYFSKADYQKAMQIKPDYAEAYNNMGNAFKSQNKINEAVSSYQKALQLNPDSAETYNDLGVALKDQGKLEEAALSYQKALKLNPDYAEAYNNLGVAFFDQGRLEEAVLCYQNALQLNPDLAMAYNNLGAAFKDQGRLKEAVLSYQKALHLKPDFAAAQF